MSRLLGRAWLPQLLINGGVMVVSILLALAINGWKANQDDQELIARVISNFENEIKRNKSRITDVSEYRNGIQQVLQDRNASGDMKSITEFRHVMDAVQPVLLTNSAWETAVATSVLAKMDFELVSALTLTYNTQTRFDENYRTTARALLSPGNLTEQNLESTIYSASQFVTDVIAQEAELVAYYDQMLKMLSSHDPTTSKGNVEGTLHRSATSH